MLCKIRKKIRHVKYIIIKGQLILIALFVFFNSPKKRKKHFWPRRLGQKLTFSSSFFGGIKDTKISFRNYLTFRKSSRYVIQTRFFSTVLTLPALTGINQFCHISETQTKVPFSVHVLRVKIHLELK